jgi:hypothetical protein
MFKTLIQKIARTLNRSTAFHSVRINSDQALQSSFVEPTFSDSVMWLENECNVPLLEVAKPKLDFSSYRCWDDGEANEDEANYQIPVKAVKIPKIVMTKTMQ